MPPRGTETILFVEDDDAVRALRVRILECHGYRVLLARDGREALDRARLHAPDIHLPVTDVVLPEIGGRKLSDLLAARRPHMRVVFMSGYTAGEIGKRGELDPSVAFLQGWMGPPR